ncbi:MAG: hypothetical protein ACKVVP_09195 [Chloroflexota bacterium]
MTFTVEDFHDLIALLEQQPAWRAELRRQLLTDEILTVPVLVRELSDAYQRSDGRLARIEAIVERLADAQQRSEARLAELAEAHTEARLEALTAQVAPLAEAQARTEARLEALTAQVAFLAEAQARTEARLEDLTAQVAFLADSVARLERRMERVEIDVGRLVGSEIERRFADRAPAYVGRWFRRAHVLTSEALLALLDETEDKGMLDEQERDAILLADTVVRGRRREDSREVYLVAEVSWGIGMGDVSRAIHRAGLLTKAGVEAMPLVAGESITAEAKSLAQTTGTEMVLIRAGGDEIAASA